MCESGSLTIVQVSPGLLCKLGWIYTNPLIVVLLLNLSSAWITGLVCDESVSALNEYVVKVLKGLVFGEGESEVKQVMSVAPIIESLCGEHYSIGASVHHVCFQDV